MKRKPKTQKYVYVVTRTMKGEPEYITSQPNLGVHSNARKALTHFQSVVEARIGEGCNVKVRASLFPTSIGRCETTHEAYILKNGIRELLQLEVWKL